MAFLLGWTKYLPNILPQYTSEHGDAESSSGAPKDDIEEEHKHLDLDFSDHDDDEHSSPGSLGGSFETLEEEIAFLRAQNAKLQSKYKYHKSQHQLLKHNLKTTGVVEMKINGQMVKVQQPHLDIGLDELAGKVEARLPKFLQRAGQSTSSDGDTIYIPSDGKSNEVGVIDIQSVDWWDMVKYDKVDANQALSTFNNDSGLQYENTRSLGGSFIVLRESDIVDAIACFVAQCVMSIPECHNLDHEEMMAMISGTFSELKEKGPLGHMMDWGSFVYQTYGWTSTAYTVYANAAMAKTVLSCMVSAAWLIGVL